MSPEGSDRDGRAGEGAGDGGGHAAESGDPVLVPLLDPQSPSAADQVAVAGALARAAGSPLRVVDASGSRRVVPDRTGPAGPPASGATAGPDRTTDAGTDPGEAATGVAGRSGGVGGHRVVAGVLRTVSSDDVEAVVLPGSGGRLRTGVVERIAVHADCDVVVANGRAGFDDVASLLLPVAGGPHSGLATDLARAIAADCDAWVDVVHVLGPDAPERRCRRAERCLAAAARRLDRPDTTTTRIVEADSTVDAIVEQSRCYELTVLGAPTTGRLRRLVGRSTNLTVRADARSVVLSARNAGDTDPLLDG